jgi:hypothetical protein
MMFLRILAQRMIVLHDDSTWLSRVQAIPSRSQLRTTVSSRTGKARGVGEGFME